MALTVLNHPLARHYINRLREVQTTPQQFRQYCKQVTRLLAIEATRDLPLVAHTIHTPLEAMDAEMVHQPVVVVAILRAGMGMVDGFVELLPDVAVGYIGLERDEHTAAAKLYYCKLPPLAGSRVIVVDPMLATGGSSAQAVGEVLRQGATDLRFVAIVAAPEGVARLEAEFPGLPILAGALDRELDDRKFIRPGLGDFGDRLFGTEQC
jgi:uracil phosphoribosyltransferase